MTTNYKRWRALFLFCLGVFGGTAFCMKWMEGDLHQNGQLFTIIGLEISYSKEKLAAILGALDPSVKTILRYHLSFDFAFMAGVYPGIAALCMMGREKTVNLPARRILFAAASLQIVAWVCDIAENLYLFNWINEPTIGDEFGRYHLAVYTKWVIALVAVLIAIPFAVRKKKAW